MKLVITQFSPDSHYFIAFGSTSSYTFLFEVSAHIPFILESNLHPSYSFRGLKSQMRIRIACGLDLRLRAGFWKNDIAAARAVRTIQ